MTDACSHAVLRGRFALEHSFFVSPSVLAVPEESPAALLARAGDDSTHSTGSLSRRRSPANYPAELRCGMPPAGLRQFARV
jgi:hypothetical protein